MLNVKGGKLGVFLAIAAVLLATSGPIAPAHAGNLVSRTCVDDGVSSLTSLGVNCRSAQRITTAALRKSNCPPSPSFRGCYKTVKVGGWSCHGLFPGEGESFTCRQDNRWIKRSGGG